MCTELGNSGALQSAMSINRAGKILVNHFSAVHQVKKKTCDTLYCPKGTHLRACALRNKVDRIFEKLELNFQKRDFDILVALFGPALFFVL